MADVFTPVKDRVLLRRIGGGSSNKYGLQIPETAKEKPTECEVIAIAQGYVSEYCGTFIGPPVSVGDHVMIGKYSGSNELKLKDDSGVEVDHLAVKWDEIIGVIKHDVEPQVPERRETVSEDARG
jgi:co-chaperonin GroES (HSP10)